MSYYRHVWSLREQRENEHVGCWRMRCRTHRRIPISEAFATSEKWGFFGSVDICSKGFACRESCYVNRQVSTYS